MSKKISKCYEVEERHIFHTPNDCTHILEVYKIDNKPHLGIFFLGKEKKKELIFECEYKQYKILFDRFIFVEQVNPKTNSTIAFVYDPIARTQLMLNKYAKKQNTKFSIKTVDGLLEIIGKSELFVFSHCLNPDYVGDKVNSFSDNEIVKTEITENGSKINIIRSESLRGVSSDKVNSSRLSSILKKLKKAF